MARLNIGIGSSNFREIITDKKYYIDKTGFIEEFLSQPMAKVSLITRPRRFGKTLTMNMLKEFFDINAEDKNLFEGLMISEHKEICREWQNQYPVLYITLKECFGLSYTSAIQRFADTIDTIARELSFLLESTALDSDTKLMLKKLRNCTEENLLANSLNLLCQSLHSYYKRKVIVLIDEYDVPIHYAHQNNFYIEMTDFIRKLLGAVLKDSPYLKFAVLTGCLRISKESIFTGLNNFKCYGISDTHFSNMFGFTAQEVDAILADAELEDKKPLFKEWYDGYTFGECSEIFCPWDVLNYVFDLQANRNTKPQLYWNNTSGNAIIKDFLIKMGSELTDKFETLMRKGCVEVALSEQQTYDMLHSSEENLWNILYMTGYLTKANKKQTQSCNQIIEDRNTLLTIPNKEILHIYQSVIREWMQTSIGSEKKKKLMDAFWSGDAETVKNILTHQLKLSISYNDYAEKFYHAILLGIFLLTNNQVKSNLEGGEGRSDLFIKNINDDLAAVIELKYTDKLEAMPRLCEEALQQIEDNEYDYDLKEDYDTIYHWGIAFYKKRCVVKAVKKEHCLRMA